MTINVSAESQSFVTLIEEFPLGFSSTFLSCRLDTNEVKGSSNIIKSLPKSSWLWSQSGLPLGLFIGTSRTFKTYRYALTPMHSKKGQEFITEENVHISHWTCCLSLTSGQSKNPKGQRHSPMHYKLQV